MTLAGFVTVACSGRALFYSCEMPEEVEADGCYIECLPSGVVTRENREVARAVEFWKPAFMVKTNHRMPIKEHGVNTEIIKYIMMSFFNNSERRLREIVTVTKKISQ